MSIEEQLADLVERTVRRVIREELGTARADYLSAVEAAQVAGVSAQTVRAWIRAGKIPGYRAGRVWRVRRNELESLLAAGNPDTEAPRDFALRLLRGGDDS